MQLYRADLRVPFTYTGDVMFYHIFVKSMVDHGWSFFNDSIGAPTGMDWRDVPISDHDFYLLLLRIFSLFTSNFGLIVNLFYLLSFPLTTITTLYVFRRFRVSWVPAIFGSLLYTFLPFHFGRGQHHLFLSAYYFVPLMVMVILWVCSGRLSLVTETEGRRRMNLRDPRLILSLIICLLIASTGTYYAFFACFFLMIAGLPAAVRRRSLKALLVPAALVAVIAAVTLVELLPDLIYLRRHGDTPVVRRNVADSEVYALKIAQLMLPVSHHRIYRVSQLKDIYNTRPFVNENDDSALGAIGVGGFLLLLGLIFYRLRDDSQPGAENTAPLLNDLSLLNVAALLLATTGGFGALFALLVSPKIRAWNRASVYIAFFSLFAVVLALDYVARNYLQAGGRRVAFYCLLAFALFVGVFDQTTTRAVPAYEQIKAEYQSDLGFVRQIEGAMPKGATIFQLPVVSFPENPKVNRMNDYDLGKGYLHSSGLRWSYGGVKWREGDVWQKLITAKPTQEMVEALSLAGFSGIYLDRYGYADNGAKMESDLSGLLAAQPLVSSNGRLAFYDLNDYSRKLKEKYPAPEWEARRDATLHPLLPLWQDGFSDEERSGENYWRWCAETGRMEIVNNSAQTRQVTLEMLIAAGRDATLRIESPLFSDSLRINFAGVPYSRALTIPPGRHTIRFFCDAPRILAPLDSRIIVFRLQNFRLKAAEAAGAVAS